MTTDPKYWYWHVDIDTSKAAMGRLGEALIRTDSGLEAGKFSRMRLTNTLGRGVTSFVVCKIPDGRQGEFQEICKPIDMRPPIRAAVGFDTLPDDGHPGRER